MPATPELSELQSKVDAFIIRGEKIQERLFKAYDQRDFLKAAPYYSEVGQFVGDVRKFVYEQSKDETTLGAFEESAEEYRKLYKHLQKGHHMKVFHHLIRVTAGCSMVVFSVQIAKVGF